MLAVEQMTAEQRALYEEVVSGPRGQLIGPLRAAIHSPELAVLWSRFGEFLRFRTCLPAALKELAILVTARRWNSQVEWWAHARDAGVAGLPADIIERILHGSPVAFADEAQREVYEYARLLQEHGHVPASLHAAIVARWGVRGVVELTAVIGYYTMVAMTLNAHVIPVPAGVEAPLPDSAELFQLAPGTQAS